MNKMSACLSAIDCQVYCVAHLYGVCQALTAWCSYVDERRRKAGRNADALEMYRRRLLRDGATRWLAVATDLSQLRLRFAAEKGIEVSFHRCCVWNNMRCKNISVPVICKQ